MITRPSAAQVALGIRRELLDVVAPDVTSERARVSIAMIENCLRNLAARADHEVAWMREECDDIEELGAEVTDRLDASAAAPVAAALAAYRDGRNASLHTADVQRDYDRAGEVLSCAAEAIVASDDAELGVRLVALLQARQARELEIMGDFAFVGRG